MILILVCSFIKFDLYIKKDNLIYVSKFINQRKTEKKYLFINRCIHIHLLPSLMVPF